MLLFFLRTWTSPGGGPSAGSSCRPSLPALFLLEMWLKELIYRMIAMQVEQVLEGSHLVPIR